MANIVYRKNVSPALNANTVFKGSPLTNDELDNNLYSINAEVQTKANTNNAVFTGTTTIPGLVAAGLTATSTISGTSISLSNSAVIGTTLNVTGATTLANTLTHNGLVLTSGTNVDQLFTVTETLTVTTSWVNTGVNFAELPTGSYMVQVSTGTEYYTGIMSWYSADIDSTLTDEIILHRASAGTPAEISSGNLFLKIERTDLLSSPNMTLQISSSVSRASASYTYKFRRMI